MVKEKLNDDAMDLISGATQDEIRELKEAILSNPYLRKEWEAYNWGGSDQDIVKDILRRFNLTNMTEFNEDDNYNQYIKVDDQNHWNYLWHSEIVYALKNYKP